MVRVRRAAKKGGGCEKRKGVRKKGGCAAPPFFQKGGCTQHRHPPCVRPCFRDYHVSPSVITVSPLEQLSLHILSSYFYLWKLKYNTDDWLILVRVQLETKGRLYVSRGSKGLFYLKWANKYWKRFIIILFWREAIYHFVHPIVITGCAPLAHRKTCLPLKLPDF